MNILSIQQLVEENQLTAAIQQLQEGLVGTARENTISVIACEYKELQEKELKNTGSAIEIQQHKSNLCLRLLNLLKIIAANNP